MQLQRAHFMETIARIITYDSVGCGGGGYNASEGVGIEGPHGRRAVSFLRALMTETSVDGLIISSPPPTMSDERRENKTIYFAFCQAEFQLIIAAMRSIRTINRRNKGTKEGP